MISTYLKNSTGLFPPIPVLDFERFKNQPGGTGTHSDHKTPNIAEVRSWLQDGRVELEFTAKGDVEVKRWIMAWGRYCTVKSPKWVKEMIDEEVAAMAAARA